MSPLNTQGGHREMFVGYRLFDWAEIHGGLVVSSSAGFKLADSSLRSPDAACPEFLVEILSESDSRAKLEEKMEMWIANGAQLAWMIDPFSRRNYHLPPWKRKRAADAARMG